MNNVRLPFAVLALSVASGCDSGEQNSETKTTVQNLKTAEAMIDAFYSFDADRLGALLTHAETSAPSLLYYQGWAEGGNYKVLNRTPCAFGPDDKIHCPVTVQDDPVLALETGFMVTDTFSLSFDGTRLTKVDTSSNDQPIYYEARKWVESTMPEVMTGPCQKNEDGGGPTPGDCARAMTEGYRQFMQARKDGDGQSNLTPKDAPVIAKSTLDFVSTEFEPPRLVEAESFNLVPLGPELVEVDYAAYMSSIEHLQQTFTRSSNWPHPDITDEEAMQDMLNEQRRFNTRESFAYAVLTKDGKRERGCVYVQPSKKPGYDAVVKLWVTKAEYDAGFDTQLFEWTEKWLSSRWPFQNVAYPGRSIEWDAWDAM